MVLLSGLSGSIQAQEFLTGSRMNPQAYKNKEIAPRDKAEAQPLTLPFFEDFSNYVGYPNEELFIDKQAFVNNTFAVFPPTIGVVTLDAINERGEIYPHLNATSKGADTLTSRFIRLDSLFVDGISSKIAPKDSIYFSFFFQPGGAGIVNGNAGEQIGNQPDQHDSLVLEFGYTIQKGDTVTTFWNHVWSTPGFSVNTWTSEDPYQYFKQVLIPIIRTDYFCDKFQFRFRNYASLEPQQGISGWESNVDQWHIDYIRLDVNRGYTDTFTNDLAFVSPTTSFLQNYQAMPWNQFRSADMKAHFTNQLTNLSQGTRISTYQYTIAKNGNVEDSYSTGAIDIDPYYRYGIQSKANQASPAISYKPDNLTDASTFIITHIFQQTGGGDAYPQNDTCVFVQQFSNYYAYDDGTAEYGYCLNNPYNIARMAMKFSLHEPALLSAVRIWFNQTKNHENENATFSIVVWADNHEEPGDTLYTLKDNKPQFAEQFLDFFEYQFDRAINVSGTIWIGFEQQGNVQLNIGFDQNNDSREFFKYNTNGDWRSSVYKGTPMLRPVFGELQKSISEAPRPAPSTMSPNPATSEVQITNYESRITNVEIFDVLGRMQKAESRRQKAEGVVIDISHLSSGIYFVKIYKENNTSETLKLLKP